MAHRDADMTRRALGAGLLILKPATAFGSQANSTVEVGMSGCGGRGTMIAGMFMEFAGARVVALHDVFQDRLDFTRDKINSPDAKLYKGYQAYQDMVASKLDAVVLESPPYARPDQAAAAVAAGKHLYMAKPVAVDVWGCQKIAATGAKAKAAKLSFFTDFQYRGRDAYRECVARVRRGDIGTPVVAHVFYHTGRLNPKNKPGEPADVSRLRNWVFDKVLSGDIIVEQNIHALDAGVWMLDAHPLSATGTGGRKVRTDVGDCWDHFVVTYWFPNDVKMDFSSTQCITGFNDICARVYGSEGTAEMHYYTSAWITGKKPWQGPEKADAGRGGTIENIKTFVDGLRAGHILNNSADVVRSNLTAVLGRTAAYAQKHITWDEMVKSGAKLELNLPKLG
jgi:myo-inositol 2-dehydrogenase / D-chiro-inositol 1-dehydrogenase